MTTCGVSALMLGWLTTCCGVDVVVVDGTTGAGPGTVVGVTGAVDVVVAGEVVVVVGGFVVDVVVVEGLGATVLVVVAASAAAPPTTPSRGPHTTTAMPVTAIDLE
jgi:hypothetical protein